MRKPLVRPFRYALFLFSGILLMTSCKKSDSGPGSSANPDYYISFKVNGVQKKYTSQAIADISYSSQSQLHDGVFAGSQLDNVADKSHIGLFLFDGNTISVKTYRDPQKVTTADGSQTPAVMINYEDDDGNGYLSMGAMVDKDGNPLLGAGNAVADAEVMITGLTTSYVKGTFSGTLVLSTDATLKTTVSITEGKFILKRIQ